MIFSSQNISVVLLSFLVFLILPITASAASARPECKLVVGMEDGTYTEIAGKGDVYSEPGNVLGIGWSGTNARKAVDGTGKDIDLSGAITIAPKKTTTYTYTFSAGSKRAVCAVTVHVLSVDIAKKSLTTEDAKPTLSGTAEGIRNVYVEVYKEKSTKPVFASKAIKVKNEKWKARVTKKLSDGTYIVRILAKKNDLDSMVAESTLTIGEVSTAKSASVLVVEPVPLLIGGVVRGGGTVSVSYLQLVNVGKDQIVLDGFSLRQAGGAPTSVIADLIAVDDTGTVHGSMVAHGGSFKNGVGFVPAKTTLAPGETRLFTLKAVTVPSIASHVGKQLRLEVSNVITSNASVRAHYPVQGTTWTLSF